MCLWARFSTSLSTVRWESVPLWTLKNRRNLFKRGGLFYPIRGPSLRLLQLLPFPPCPSSSPVFPLLYLFLLFSPPPTISSTILRGGYYLSFQEEAFETQRGRVTGPATASQMFQLRIQTLTSCPLPRSLSISSSLIRSHPSASPTRSVPKSSISSSPCPSPRPIPDPSGWLGDCNSFPASSQVSD